MAGVSGMKTDSIRLPSEAEKLDRAVRHLAIAISAS
jgi:hypothetical protein